MSKALELEESSKIQLDLKSLIKGNTNENFNNWSCNV